MWRNWVRPALAASLWVAAVCLMIVRSVDPSTPPQASAWSILLALGGCVFIGWHLLFVERTRTEEVARIAAEVAIEHIRLRAVGKE